jgi:2-isopropylmalate synthase
MSDGDINVSAVQDRVIVFDTTLRDGEQSPGATLTAEEKLQVADALFRLKVDVIEAGFPAASPGDFEAVREIARRSNGTGVTVAGLARANRGDIERAAQAVQEAEKPRIHTFIATSDIHLQYKLRMSREEVIERVRESVTLAKSFVDDVEFSCEDATRSDRDFMVEVFSVAVECGATTLNVPDTVGYTTPFEYHELITYLKNNVRGADNVIFSVHCHDDLGMATANTLIAVKAGARQVEVTMNGIGERAGNTSLEEVVMALETRGPEFGGARTQVATERLVPTSRLVSNLTGIAVQANKAIVGSNAFAHEAGIHQDGMLKERTTYEIMNPADVGWEGTSLVLGKHSGRAGFRSALSDLGFHLDDTQMQSAYERFLELADRKKKVTGADLEALIADEEIVHGSAVHLVDFTVNSAHGGDANAMVVVTREDRQFWGRSGGNGPIDALLSAIDSALGIETELTYFNVEAVTPGEDAQGQVHMRVRHNGQTYSGHGLATDTVEASAKAYIAAVSQMINAQPDIPLAGMSFTSRWS